MQDSRDEFEKELDEYFQTKHCEKTHKITHQSQKNLKCNKEEPSMPLSSGCCMTGCHNCPWGYTLPNHIN